MSNIVFLENKIVFLEDKMRFCMEVTSTGVKLSSHFTIQFN